MEETLGQQYALQIALQTMKERCLQLQQRLSKEEEENLNLKLKYHVDDFVLIQDNKNKSEIELLRQKVAQLTKQKSQLTHNVLMVATENRNLWNRLSKLTQTNQILNEHLTKVNDTLNQSQQPTLIRSETFLQKTDKPKLVKKTETESYNDTSLEDISLKIINNIAQEKYELEKQCAQMTEMQTNESFLSNSIGFTYPDDELDECVVSEFAQNVDKLASIKDSLIGHRDKLKQQFELFKVIVENNSLCKNCKGQHNKENESQSASSNRKVEKNGNEHICPMCNKVYFKEDITNFIKHVQNHFVGEDNFELDFEEVILDPNLSKTK